jgi:SOS response regulatory protein OraA/RecX
MEALIAKGRGRLRIAAEMKRKGLDEEMVRYTLEDGALADGERERAMDAARKVWDQIPEGTDARKAMMKVNRRLVTLGYTYDVIGEVVSRLRRSEAGEEDKESGDIDV